MDFELSDEQRQLADSLGRLLNDRYSFEARSKRLATAQGVDDAFWGQLAELGVLSLPVSEASGGFGAGAVDLMQPMALLGQALVVEPVMAHLTSCVLLERLLDGPVAAGDVKSAPSGVADPAPYRRLLERCVAGEQRLAWAHVDDTTEAGHDDPVRFGANGAALDGTKIDVEGADRADWLLVTVAPDHEPSDAEPVVVLVPAKAEGMAIRGYRLLDNRQASEVRFGATALAGDPPGGRIGDASGEPVRQAIKEALDFSAALLCAEAVGVIDFACQTTLEYLKTRKQFGVPIGSFQALQHRIVDLYVELEQVRSMAALACSRVDGARTGQVGPIERGRAVAAARVYIARAARKVAQESIQLHGGMGMAEEMKVSHAFRRLTLLARQGGHESSHLDRFIEAGREQARRRAGAGGSGAERAAPRRDPVRSTPAGAGQAHV